MVSRVDCRFRSWIPCKHNTHSSILMKLISFIFALFALFGSLAFALPATESENNMAVSETAENADIGFSPASDLYVARQSACLPVSCGDLGCCSGDCRTWCRRCGIPFSC
ncbi:uncharacterized protein BYT42DRAFT_563887 [Radiomyces spectabilis]|uniref:uncharacterized protein n=1 Tax=Radiomyces spectabilis TaxID=64574 RepID=UPI00221EFDDF|nr:uncharacterized protein BYT42DRAFT_563887 [Radiomyces spectabilis]KAI8384860.1 hypothetical protein BYT42DRAFT_563887 [Radiomyces spectabilis]